MEWSFLLDIKKKVITLTEFAELREDFRKQNIKIAHCHGVFDLLHPGHIVHLQEAKKMADLLVVSITAAAYVNRGPGRPYFSDEMRMSSLAALECVDYVVLVEGGTALPAIEAIKPSFYVKGQEYADAKKDVTGNIDIEAEKVREHGGELCFTDGVVFSSTKLLNQFFPVFPPELKTFAYGFSQKHPFEELHLSIERMRDLKVLIIGDIIIDEYAFCNVQGLVSKDRAFSAKYLQEERYLGGALAIARHAAEFSSKVSVCGIIGNDSHLHSRILSELGSKMIIDLQFDSHFRTVVKRRYVERHGIRNEYEKIFSVNFLPDEVEKVDRSLFYYKLESIVADYDLVIVADYGHGLLDGEAMRIIQEKASFLALNCQTNSSNFGTNLITKYQRAHMFALDERELRLAFADQNENVGVLLDRLLKHLSSEVGWVTLGSLGSVSCNLQGNIEKTPALTLTVKDTVGAGDAFFVLASLCARLEVNQEVASFLSNLAGALAANILGNAHAVKKSDLLKFATTLLKF